MKYSILITYYSGKNLVNSAVTLLCQSLGDRQDVEIIISNDNPNENITAFSDIDKYNRIHIINSDKNGGYSVALNRAAQKATGCFLVLMDSDIFVTPNWLNGLEKAYNDNKNVGCVSSTILSINNGSVVHWGLSIVGIEVLKPYRDYYLPQKVKNSTTEFPLLTSGCLMVSRELFNKVHGMDPMFYNGYCDLDFAAKIRELGYSNYATTESIVYHRGKVAGQIRLMGEEDTRALFFARWSDKLKIDGIKLFQKLLLLYGIDFSRKYLLLNCSKSIYFEQYIESIKNVCNCTIEIIYDYKSCQLPLMLEDICPWNLCAEKTSIMYFCDNATLLLQNKHWFFHRKGKGDIIVDRNGNVIQTDSLI